MRGLLHQLAESVTSLNRPLLRSFRALLLRPGFLTVAYLRGQRKPYTLPLQLFLAANVLFFAVQSLTQVNVFSTHLDAHLHNQAWSSLTQRVVEDRMATRNTTLEQYAPVFDQAVTLNAKSLVILMVLPFSALPALLFFRRGLPLAAHIVFSLHFYAFLLLLFCVSLAVSTADQAMGGPGLDSDSFDQVLSVVEIVLAAVYLYIGAKVAYGATGIWRVLQAATLAVSAAGLVLAYRFMLLLITFYST